MQQKKKTRKHNQHDSQMEHILKNKRNAILILTIANNFFKYVP